VIHEVTGDILLTRAQAIAHGIAPNDHFTSGLALALRERWPAMASDFRHYAHQAHPQPGDLWIWGGTGGIRIVNLLTQEGSLEHGGKPGRATLPNVNHCLRKLRQALQSGEIRSLALPRLATGVGGQEWPDVQRLVVQHLGDLATPVFVYTTWRKGERADEPGA
jgi:O-acetyl-ADP-ribose deacetylase (regulator of RNase III)